MNRLNAVKRAVAFQIKELNDESPNVRVGLIAFGSEVILFGREGELFVSSIPMTD